jgi:putative PIN family toxin of toxin-antitoxin system
MSKCRAVFDTGILVSAALLRYSVPRKAIDAALQHGRLIFSQATIAEVDEVLRRPKFERYVSEQVRIDFLTALIDQAEVVSVSTQVQLCRDPKDDKFLELAVDGLATHIISSDADLLVLESFEGIPIVSPGTFIEMLSRE